MVRLDLWKWMLKKDSSELGFEVREGGEISQAGRQQMPDSWSNETERTVAKYSQYTQSKIKQNNRIVIIVTVVSSLVGV